MVRTFWCVFALLIVIAELALLTEWDPLDAWERRGQRRADGAKMVLPVVEKLNIPTVTK